MDIVENINHIKESLPNGVTLVAVSKFHPVQLIEEAYSSGQRIFAESRPQEFAAKVAALPKDIEWHFIGHLQTNKLKMVLPYCHLLQSVDSLHLLDEVNRWGRANSKVVNVLIELHLGAELTKQGFSSDEITRLIGLYDSPDKGGYDHIRILGLMGMATNTSDESVIDSDFARIHSLMTALRESHPSLVDFTELSIGMSDDWPIAVRHGATMVRVGSAIFGARSLV